MITQTEYEDIKSQQKEFCENEGINLGPHPIKWSRELKSIATKESFLLDFCRNSIKISKYSFNKRYRGSINLIRYCSDKPHTNPPEVGGQHFPGAHLHLYQEGYDDKIAVDPSTIGIDTGCTMDQALIKIISYFNVINVPLIQTDLL